MQADVFASIEAKRREFTDAFVDKQLQRLRETYHVLLLHCKTMRLAMFHRIRNDLVDKVCEGDLFCYKTLTLSCPFTAS